MASIPIRIITRPTSQLMEIREAAGETIRRKLKMIPMILSTNLRV